MASPRVGSSVRGSASGRPIMVALDVLGRRGALRVLWELRDASLMFRALQAAADMNPASLKRIKELRALEIIDHSGDGYHLTQHGRSLMAAFEPLQAWAAAWARQVDL
ncbi:winged helix-turn-helix transcriptional regulator [Mycobacterium sp.]|uniref:winged helix-turn-helix transcriptional regulator n=1 Tax=Mycobacterium sp. TaxID=1785 RepID=UPI002CD8AD7A|nr:winged helix-turn-helix transcriptional regulator [Mycobacterium sp.]HTH88721.1 winged helix-turn-helix transcriptional regulator [Mycobacterium sp.]